MTYSTVVAPFDAPVAREADPLTQDRPQQDERVLHRKVVGTDGAQWRWLMAEAQRRGGVHVSPMNEYGVQTYTWGPLPEDA